MKCFLYSKKPIFGYEMFLNGYYNVTFASKLYNSLFM